LYLLAISYLDSLVLFYYNSNMQKSTYSTKEIRYFIFGILGVIVVFIIVIFININTPKFTTFSPDKQYRLAVYREISLSTLLKSGYFDMAKLLLKDENGKVIGHLGSRDECKIEYNKVRTDWKPDENRIYFADNYYFSLPDGSVFCPKN